jgi:pimeloyl-ACP methyl ester carboxylesterase
MIYRRTVKPFEGRSMKRWLRVLLIVFGSLFLILIILPLLIPIPPLKDVAPPKQLAGPTSQFIEIDGLEVHYQSLGEGRPVHLLLHGFMANVYTWRETIEPLSDMGRVIAYDRPAFGLTQRPLPEEWEGENPYSPEAQTELLIHLMDALAVDQAILVGNSAGGTQALYTYLTHPDRVQALILVDPAVYIGSGAPSWVKPLLATPQMRRIGPWLLRSITGWGESLLDLAWHDPSRIQPDALQDYAVSFRVQNWDRALWEYMLASRQLDLATRLNEVQAPTLVITGDDDRIVPTAQSIRLAQELPSAELVVITDCGHMPQEECPQSFLDAVSDFSQAID